MYVCIVGDKAFKPCKETDKPSATIDDLEEDEEIEFRVAAVNEAGRSMPSPPLKVKVKEPECKFQSKVTTSNYERFFVILSKLFARSFTMCSFAADWSRKCTPLPPRKNLY